MLFYIYMIMLLARSDLFGQQPRRAFSKISTEGGWTETKALSRIYLEYYLELRQQEGFIYYIYSNMYCFDHQTYYVRQQELILQVRANQAAWS